MGTVTNIHEKSPEQLAADEFLNSIPAKFAACHGMGHRFPRPGDKRKGLLKRETFADGSAEYSAKCPECGTIRYRFRARGASYSEGDGYRYDYPDGYLAPKGTGDILKRGTYQDLAFRLWEDELDRPTGGEEMPRFSDVS